MSTGLQQGQFVGGVDCGSSSVRLILFDSFANIVASHQLEFSQYYPHPGWHEHDPNEILAVSEACIAGAVRSLEEEKRYDRSSVKVIGITNQRETTVAWSRKTGKPLCRAIVWTDNRNKGEVSMYEMKLVWEGIEIQGKIYKGEEAVDALANM